MEQTTEALKVSKGPLLETEPGYYYSATVLTSPKALFEFCQNPKNIEKTLSDLPGDLESFLDLELESAQTKNEDFHKIVYRNRPGAKTEGTFTFLLKKAPASRGTMVTGEARFKKINFKDEKRSDLVNLFLKRLKALMETGEIPTIKGQPSGREEKKILH